MREIEVKAKVGAIDSLREVFKNKGVLLSDPVTQHDIVWGVESAVRGDNAPWLRLRTESKTDGVRYLFTLKRSMTGNLDSIEHETEIDNPDAVIGMVKELGFVPYSDITKTRQKAYMGDKEICLDSVEGLGDFIEAEKLTGDDADSKTVEDELWSLMKDFGVSQDDEVTVGYDVLINRKLGKE